MNGLIYVVDYERIIAETSSTILKRSGFNAIPFFNAPDALKAAEMQRPDVFISNVIMPEMNGIKACISIKALYPTCKIFLVSGLEFDAPLLQDARNKGHDFHFLQKPVRPTHLLAAIQQALQ